MSLVEQFEYLLSRRTCQKSFEMKRGKSTQPSNTLLGLNKLSQSIYQEAFVQKINSSPCKNNVDKFQELRRKLATRGTERSKRASVKSTNKDNLQNDESTINTIDMMPNSLLCSKAIVHSDIRQQEVVWKKALRQIGQQESKSKDLDDDGSATTNFLKPKRRFSQDIQTNNFSSTIFVGKHTKLNRQKKTSEITTGSAESPEQRSPSRSYRIKCSPRKLGSNNSELTKESKSSENELGFDKIDPWRSCFEEDDEVLF